MKKVHLERRVYEAHGGMTRREVEAAVDLVLGLMKDALARGEKVKLRGFGILQVVNRRGKQGRHPKTGQIIRVRARKSVVFKVSRNVWSEGSDGG